MRLPAPVYRAKHRSSPLWSSLPDLPAHEPGDDPIYGAALSVAAAHAGQANALRCTLCEVPLRAWTDPNGTVWWVHADAGGTFQCRGEHGMVLDGQYATPPPGTPPLPGSPAPCEGMSSPDTNPPAPALPGGHVPPASPARGRPPRPPCPPRPYPAVVASYPAELVEGIILGHPGAA